jgi:hypothetical protein
MKRSISMSKLKVMSPSLRDETLAALVTSTRRLPNGELEALRKTIAFFEHKYDLSSEELKVKVAGGHLTESEEICQWLMALRMRDRLERLEARAH